MEILGFVNLDKNGVGEDDIRYFDDNGELPIGNFNQEDIEGRWLLIDGKPKIKVGRMTWAYRDIDNTALIKVD